MNVQFYFFSTATTFSFFFNFFFFIPSSLSTDLAGAGDKDKDAVALEVAPDGLADDGAGLKLPHLTRRQRVNQLRVTPAVKEWMGP